MDHGIVDRLLLVITVKGYSLYIWWKIYLGSIKKLEDSVKFRETKLYFHDKGALLADNANPNFRVKEALFTMQ